MSNHLFDPGTPDPPAEKLSATRRRTIRINALLERGIHPVTKEPSDPRVGTCGNCTHIFRRGEAGRYFHKCGLVNNTYGPGTDIRVSWPACHRFEPRDSDE